MKNKFLIKFLCAFIAFACFAINVNASDNKYSYLDTTIKRPSNVKASFVIDYSLKGGNSKAVYYNDANGNHVRFEPLFKVDQATQYSVYCVEASEGSITRKTTFKYKGLVDDPGLVYVIKKTSNAGVEDAEDYTISQFSVWFYMHEVWSEKYKTVSSPRYIAKTSTYAETYTNMMQKAAKISDAAVKKHNAYVEPSMGDLIISSKNLKVENNYLVSEEISVPLTGISQYEVKVDNGKVINSEGKNQTVFNANEKFRVKVDTIASTEVNVTVTVNYEKQYVVIYNNPNDPDSQDIVYPDIIVIPYTITKNLKLTYVQKGSAEISKVDITNNKELPGATLVIKDSKGNEVDKWVSTTEPHKVSLSDGIYILTETIAPKGYILSTEEITFKVVKGEVTKVTMKNAPMKDIEFSKVDVTTGKELPGATLVIKDSKGNEVDKWVSTEEIHKVKLMPGVYTLTEMIAPKGYILSTETVTFTVKSDGTCDKVVMENAPIKSVEFSKVDATTGEELPGAHLEIKDSKNNVVESWISTSESHYVVLEPGVYTLTETIAPKGYILSTETVTFTVKSDGTCDKVVMENKPIITEVPISKIDATTGKELPGAHLELRDENNNLIDSWISTTEIHKVMLRPGKYILTETIAPKGYELKTESIIFNVKDDGTCDKVVMKNIPYHEIPKTDKNASTMIYIFGSVLLILGGVMVFKYGKKEEC